MNKLNASAIFILILLITTFITGCKKDNDDPEVKKSVWAVGDLDTNNYGTIYFSGDGGQLWIRQGEGQNALLGLVLSDVWAVDDKTVYAVGSPGTLIKTINGGDTWEKVPIPATKDDSYFVSISMVGSNDIWISGAYGLIIHSADGGNTWDEIQSEVISDYYLQGINAVTSDLIYVAGGHNTSDSGFVAFTRDGGQTWEELVPQDNYDKNRWIGCTSSDENNIIVYGGKSHYMLSTDGGQTWKNDSVPDTGGTGGADINCLKMLNNQTWWGAFDYDYIGKTTNAGGTWTKQTSAGPGGMWLLGIDYYNNDIGVIVGESSMSLDGKILNTIDGGNTWELALSTDVHMYKVSFIH